MKKNNFRIFCVVPAWVVLFGVTGALEEEDEQAQVEYYCEMVKLNKEDPALGWPDFKGVYSEICKL